MYSPYSPFTTKRLIYRAIEGPSAQNGNSLEDLNICHEISFSDPRGLANSDPRLFRPAGTKAMEFMHKFYDDCLLAVMICVKEEFDHVRDDGYYGDGEPSVGGEDMPTTPKPTSQSSNHKERKKPTKPRPIGMIIVKPQPPDFRHHRHGEIGIQIAVPYTGKGYGSEAINWATDWGFLHAGFHRVEISGCSNNPGARALYERLGFVKEGVSRDWAWWDGRWWDMVNFAMLEDEWRALRARQEGDTGISVMNAGGIK